MIIMSNPITKQELDACLLEDRTTVITTITNYGYLMYTCNMLKSLAPYGLDKKVLIVCIDKRAATILKGLGYHVCCMDDATLSRFSSWNTKGYDKICYIKLKVIYYILSLQKNVLLVDGDIVFKKNPISDIISFLLFFDIKGFFIAVANRSNLSPRVGGTFPSGDAVTSVINRFSVSL